MVEALFVSKKEENMDSNRFKELLDELDGNSLETLKEKSTRYAQNGDLLHNFRNGAEIIGGTSAQACWGYMTKHLASLRDMVDRNDFSNREDFLEKCQDTINYIRFLWCIGNDKENLEKRTGKEISANVLYTTCAEALKESKGPGTVQVVNRILENMREKENE